MFQLQTRDGRIARHFIVGDLCVHSAGGIYPHADLNVIFCDALCGSQALRRESRPQAFLEGIPTTKEVTRQETDDIMAA